MSIIKRQTILGTLYSFLGIFLGAFTQIILFGNFFSVSENGLVQILSRWVTTFAYFICLGFPSAGIRYFHYFRDPEKKHTGFLFVGLMYFLIGAIITMVGIYFFKPNIVASQGKDSQLFVEYYYLLYPCVLLSGLFFLFENYTKGLYDTLASTFLQNILQRIVVFVGAVLYAFQWISFFQFLLIWASAFAITSVLMLLSAIKLGDFSIKPVAFFWKAPFRNEFIRYSLISIVTGVASFIIATLDSLMVYAHLGLGQTGIYNLCLFFGTVMTMSYTSNLKASTGLVVDFMHTGEFVKIREIFKKSSVTQFIFGLSLLIPVVSSLDVLFMFLKPEYSQGKYVLLIIGFARLYDISSGLNSVMLSYSKYYRLDSFIIITFVGLLFGLNYYLIPLWGINGAGIATLIAIVYLNTVRNTIIYYKYKIQPFSVKHIQLFALGLVCMTIGYFLPNLTDNFVVRSISLVYKSALTTGLFIVIVYFLGFSKEINGLIDSVLVKAKKMFFPK